MCKPNVKGTKCVMDCLMCPYELFSPDCINSQLKDLSTLADVDIRTIRYEEEVIIDFDAGKTQIITEYVKLARQIEALMADPSTYGLQEDDGYSLRKRTLQKFYEYMFMNPVVAVRTLEEYNEAPPARSVFMEGYRHFLAWVKGIMDRIPKSQMYELTKKFDDIRQVFLSLSGLKGMQFMSGFVLAVPEGAVPVKEADASYELPYGVRAQIYELPDSEANLYVQENPLITQLDEPLMKILKKTITEGLVPSTGEQRVDFASIYDTRMREYRQHFIDTAGSAKIALTTQQALAMAREATNWTIGLGSPVENLTLDRENITDIFIDGENSPIYVEHAKFGLCHTLWRYNREMLGYSVRNILSDSKQVRRFDYKNPIVDMMMTRVNLRCHIQGPPATFGETQLALRLTKETPFTYPQYLDLKSMTAFFAGYDNLLVGLGCSEAVLGLKGVGKTAFTSAKIIGIGTKKRILPIQDIEEIPVKAYRKRGFHIGAMRVQSSDTEDVTGVGGELSLIAMANASLRMGESCLIINEVRSRLALQGLINLLNTQPGVFVLYNLHAQSIRDIQDRFELVFSIPAASMFTTDRYTFIRKMRFGRKGRVYRLIGQATETDQAKREFVNTFMFTRGENMAGSRLECAFIENPEANAWSLAGLDLAKFEKELTFKFVPPALKRRADTIGLTPQQCVMQAFFKGKVYSEILESAKKLGKPELTDIDFVLRCESKANKLLKEMERENGSVDYAALQQAWAKEYTGLLEAEVGAKPEGKTG
ncbi:MAG: ATPase, T2SS/T4P/T4SS family [Candidatus Micrarchaeota archaeon]|nr:ATPase, T2SS/T4P/T4SS family [Candidatus Micrarchaeota archaeon]